LLTLQLIDETGDMTIEPTQYQLQIKDFAAAKQAQLFQSLKAQAFSGKVYLKSATEKEWIFYLYVGRILYATGGNHKVRRWRRNLAICLPRIARGLSDELSKIEVNSTNFQDCWEYELLCWWVEQKKISVEEATKMIRRIMTDIFFDINQAEEVGFRRTAGQSLGKQLAVLDAQSSIVEAWKIWNDWQGAKLENRSPNSAPVIKRPEQLRVRTEPKTYEALTKLLDGEHTFLDLALQMNREALQVVRSLMPYIQMSFVETVEIPDLPIPLSLTRSEEAKAESPTDSQLRKPKQDTLIACIDDSPLICQAMEKIIKAEGYRFVGESNDLRALPLMLEQKPDLIFIDLLMPNTNGYELCAQLRRLVFFKTTPIVIFTANANLMDKVKAKMVGCTTLLNKPVDGKTILKTISQLLAQSSEAPRPS
jgi:two-component system, chemotaxis family, response regulator PixG